MVEWTLYRSGAEMIKRFPVISADVFQTNIGTIEQRQDLIDQAYAEQKRNPDTMLFTNPGCWRSYYKYTNIDWLMNEIRLLINQAGTYYQELDPTYKEKTKNFVGSEIVYWTNINKPGSKNKVHEHRMWQYVAVYYLQATGTGDIVFYNPNNVTDSCNLFAPFTSTIAITPVEGDLIVFPAWLPHEVETNTSNKDRINISMNIRFNPKSDTEYAQN